MSSTDGAGDKKIEGRKKRVILGYNAMMISYLLAGLSSVINGGFTANSLGLFAAYIVMPAGISYIMISAAQHDRLNSDTYKRMNLAMLEYGMIGLTLKSLGSTRDGFYIAAFLLSVINSIKGYAYGVLGLDKSNTDTSLVQDLMNGTKSTIKGFFSIPKTIKSFGYLAATYMLAAMKLSKLKEIIQFIQANSVTSELSLLIARFNRLALLTLMLYTLKDAADRDRLGGTTFIQLNYLCAIAMIATAPFLDGGLKGPLGAANGVGAAFCAFNGITSYMKNQYA